MKAPIQAFVRRAKRLLSLVSQASPGNGSADTDYLRRMEAERQSFNDCANVHDLPEIFHYWSEKHLAPKKFHQFGITDPDQFFFLYCKKMAEKKSGPLRMVSIGAGNCDMEARLARRLLDEGISDFRLECTDINQAMLERGREHARQMEVAEHVFPAYGDFNDWRPEGHYDVVLANQCLHHVLELEKLFATIKSCLAPDGYFLTSDMIGRNGHQRWPEALSLVQQFWNELPEEYRNNRLLNRHEAQYINHDCSTESFEGIRAQDILPLLVKNFQFELFLPFANIVTVFIDRPFGHNFNAEGEWDRDFIDRLHARDEEAIMSGEIKPTQMLAVLRNEAVETTLLDPRLTPEFCIRPPERETVPL